MLVIDFETKSRVNLPKHGAYRYAADLSTDILCCAFYDLDTDAQYVWYPDRGEIMPNILYAIEKTDFIVAHNAEFDRLIWESIAVQDYGFPEIKPEKWYCSSAQCRVNALPASLKDAGFALNLSSRKFDSGAGLIKKLSIPQADGTFNDDPELHQQMRDYCMQDALVTGEIVRSTRLMSQDEHLDWMINFEINDRGVMIDRDLATYALDYADEEQAEIAGKLTSLTNGEITKHTQNIRIKNWVLEHEESADVHQLEQLMTVYKKGEKKLSLDKSVRRNILTLFEEGGLNAYPEDICNVIQLLDDGNKSSVAKFAKMLDLADDEDDRVRGAFLFAGATQTLRYTSRGLQLHNMTRKCWSAEDAEDIKEQMYQDYVLEKDGKDLPVMSALSKMLRPAIIPAKGKTLVVGDWSAIEARVLPWLSKSSEGDAVLDVFASGKDIYMETAKGMGVDDRFIGKVATLALGYQGGVNAFQAMAKNYGLFVDDTAAKKIVDQWRFANGWAVRFWAALDIATRKAMKHPNKWFPAGRVAYMFVPDLIEGTLVCKLPNDQLIQYPKARVEEVQTPYGMKYSITAMKAAFKPAADAKEWPRTTLYGGLFCENICQATAACLLREALRDLRKSKAVVATVHDEIVLEVDEELAEKWAGQLQSVMEALPSWAGGLPLNAEPVIMRRYGK